MEPIAACDTIYTISCFRNDTFLIQILNASSFYSIELHKKAFFFYHCVTVSLSPPLVFQVL